MLKLQARNLVTVLLIFGVSLVLSNFWKTSSSQHTGAHVPQDSAYTDGTSRLGHAGYKGVQSPADKVLESGEDNLEQEMSKLESLERQAAAQRSVVETLVNKIKEKNTKEDNHKIQDAQQDYLKDIFKLFHIHRPLNEKFYQYESDSKAPTIRYDEDKAEWVSNERLSHYLKPPTEALEQVKHAHSKVVEGLPDSYPEHLFQNKTGVAFIAEGRFMPMVTTSLYMLRKVAPDLPVEVFFPTRDDYEQDVCDHLESKLGATCVVISEALGPGFTDLFEIRGYQLKILSALVSSFENVILLDSDNFPVLNPETIIEQEPFKSVGYILWPDYWFRTTSPDFYRVAGIELGSQVRGVVRSKDTSKVPQSDLEGAIPGATTESGQVVISKRMNFRALLLTTYYNLYGFTTYYPLLSQGALGEGDKETFAAAETALGSRPYQVQEKTGVAGYFQSDGSYKGTMMAQHDPSDDFKKNALQTTDKKPRVMFCHSNIFKMNVVELFYGRNSKLFKECNRFRFYGPLSSLEAKFPGRDLELELWQITQILACETPEVRFQAWMDHNVNEICTLTKDQINWLKANPES